MLAQAGPMRLAAYRIPRARGDPADAELSVIRVGGSIDAGIEGWKAQFALAPGESAKRTRVVVRAVAVDIVRLQGIYGGAAAGHGSGPLRQDYVLLAAIAATEPQPHYFKLLGPRRTVDAARADFDVLVGSIRPR